MGTLPHKEPVGCSGSEPLRQASGSLREVFGQQLNPPQRAVELEQHQAVEVKAQGTGTRAGSRPSSQTKARRRASAGGHLGSAGAGDGTMAPYRPSRRATTTAALPLREDSAHSSRDDLECGPAMSSDEAHPSAQSSAATAVGRCDDLPDSSYLPDPA